MFEMLILDSTWHSFPRLLILKNIDSNSCWQNWDCEKLKPLRVTETLNKYYYLYFKEK